MSAVVLTAASEKYAALAAYTLPNKQAYCQMHGYTLTDFSRVLTNYSWDKLRALFTAMVRLEADLFAWLDCDAIVTNPQHRLEHRLGAVGAEWALRDVMLARDDNGVNAGIILLRRSPGAFRFLYAVLNLGFKRYGKEWAGEQRALEWYALHPPEGVDVEIAPQRLLNGYRYRESCSDLPVDGHPGEWQPGDFILHLAGVSDERKVQIARDFLGDPAPLPVQ